MFAWLFSREARRRARINRERRALSLPPLDESAMRRGVSLYNQRASIMQAKRTNSACDDFLIHYGMAQYVPPLHPDPPKRFEYVSPGYDFAGGCMSDTDGGDSGE